MVVATSLSLPWALAGTTSRAMLRDMKPYHNRIDFHALEVYEENAVDGCAE